MVPQETLGAPLKPCLDASGAASATAGSAPVFLSSTTSFFGGAQEFFSAPATDFLLKQEDFFLLFKPIYFRRNYYEFSKETNYI